MRYIKRAGMFLLLGGMLMLFGCGNKMYKIDYCGEQGCYEDAKDSYKEGKKVTLRYGLIATDTNYYFYLDDEPVDYKYEDGAYVISFIMPGHDVKLECRTSNLMAYTRMAVTVTNQVKTADVWIIPDTEENRKTTIWGAATISQLGTEASETVYLNDSADEAGAYLIRMIDEDGMFYSVDGINLEDNQSIVIRETEDRIVIIEIYDVNGTKLTEDEMFAARL